MKIVTVIIVAIALAGCVSTQKQTDIPVPYSESEVANDR